VSVVSDKGESSFVTTASREVNGWFNLNAANFTFSAPSIKVKLSQERPVVSQPAQPEKNQPTVVTPTQKKRIVCNKGAKRVRVVDLEPKCPKGFKVRKG